MGDAHTEYDEERQGRLRPQMGGAANGSHSVQLWVPFLNLFGGGSSDTDKTLGEADISSGKCFHLLVEIELKGCDGFQVDG